MNYEIIKNENNEVVTIKKTNNDGSVSYIPTDSANSDYQAYLRWLENPNA